jgi:FkbM family methyltransferase
MLRRIVLKLLKINDQRGASLANLVFKRIILLISGSDNSSTSQLIKRIYRRTGSRIKLNKSYSFNGEDSILSRYLPESEGSYLDIGCGNPIKGNNTYQFYKRGWKGHCVDPIPKLIRRHRIFRPRDLQHLGVIGDTKNKSTFYEFDANDFSTTSIERLEELVDKGFKVHKIRNPFVFEISSLAIQAKPDQPFLLDIDVEGTEFDILSSIDWEHFTPRVIAIEEWDSPIYKPTPVRRLLETQKYRLTCRAYVTSIYVHSTYLDSSALQ